MIELETSEIRQIQDEVIISVLAPTIDLIYSQNTQMVQCSPRLEWKEVPFMLPKEKIRYPTQLRWSAGWPHQSWLYMNPEKNIDFLFNDSQIMQKLSRQSQDMVLLLKQQAQQYWDEINWKPLSYYME